MGTYLTIVNVVDRVGLARAAQLSAESGSDPDTTVINAIIEEAEGQINAAIEKRYTLPLTLANSATLAAVLRKVAMALTLESLQGRRPPVDEAATSAGNWAREWLKTIAAGDMVLPTGGTGSGTGAGAWGSKPRNEFTV